MSLLQQGVAAAKAGDASTARRLLQKSTELYPQSEMAWFWLAYVSENPREKVNSLKRVLEINPAQEQARTVLKRALLQSGINSAKSGDRPQARLYLREASTFDPTNELVWMWMASVSENQEEALHCIHTVLEINPENERARGWLTKLKPSPSAPLVSAPPPAPAAPPASLAPVTPVARVTPVAPPAPPAIVEPPKPAWQCPLCLATAATVQQTCPTCRAVLSLTDLDAITENSIVDQDLVQKAIERYNRHHNGNGDFAAHFHMGLAHLNLNQSSEAIQHLKTACELQPENHSLRSQLQRLTERFERLTASYQPEPEPEPEPEWLRVILLVDDSPTIRKLVAVTLERQGYRVLVAAGGMEALAKLNETVPDFILLDISMPHMDGYQLCKLIKTNAATRHVPVVMLSGKDGFFDKVRGRMAGANDYLTKPFEPSVLVQVIEKHCGQSA